MKTGFNHFDEHGNAIMVDVSEKEITERIAVASGKIKVNQVVMDAIVNGTAKKGDVLGVARVAGIMGTKQTSSLIPMCHPLCLNKSTIDFDICQEELTVKAICTVKVSGKTGVEMEALMGVNTALLTIYDMCKAMDRGMEIYDVHLCRKEGGKSGIYQAEQGTKPYVFCISGCKNSGKTTFIEHLLSYLIEKKIKIAVIKHDGHTFEPDVPGTDSYRIRKAGAANVAVYCDERNLIVREAGTSMEHLIEQFHDVDLILIEGGKESNYPKIEILRKENSDDMVCRLDQVVALATNKTNLSYDCMIGLEDYKEAAEIIINRMRGI
jgi:cyclic pyranopterin phosphate synthase